MSDKFRRLKQKYDEIQLQISNLHNEQVHIRNLMEEYCTHEHLEIIEPDPLLDDWGIGDDEVKYKCKDCFRYLNEDEIKSQ